MGLDLTPQERANWQNFKNAVGKQPKNQPLKFVPPSRRKEAVNLFLKAGSLKYVMRNMHMGRTTLLTILDLYGVEY